MKGKTNENKLDLGGKLTKELSKDIFHTVKDFCDSRDTDGVEDVVMTAIFASLFCCASSYARTGLEEGMLKKDGVMGLFIDSYNKCMTDIAKTTEPKKEEK